MNTEKDIAFLEMAFGLAEKARGWTSPNPYVGAVITKGNRIVGTGYHERPGRPHAEIIALQQAGSLARNGTAYISLEPCVHWGRTPPCVDSLIQAGLKRIVVSALDPNPLVYTKGVKRMREAGINVSVGLLREKNIKLNEVYNKYIQKRIPFVTAKIATSVDGKIATKTLDSKWITSRMTREYAHLLRGEHQALMAGIGTLLRDDPRLTVRHLLWKGKQITRVIIDSKLRFPLQAKILNTLNKGKILIFTHQSHLSRKADALQKKGVQIIALPSDPSRKINLKKVLSWLGKNEISSVFVEGGGLLLTSLLERNLIDKIYITFSPIFIGGEKAPSFFEGKGISSLSQALSLKNTHCFAIGKDMILEGYL
jgi:diaminohydroxyphosphoribosylaminopyrimidine deaminase/5-amino-6-(5-phosphoribosylamino)uracil reductase